MFEISNFMTNNELGAFQQMSSISRYSYAFVLTMTWIAENVMKYVIYKSISRMKIHERPINLLIILNQVIDHIISSLFVLNFLCMAPFGTSSVAFLEIFLPLSINSSTFCWTLCYLTAFWISCSSYIGLGIALYRMLFVTKLHFIWFKIGSNIFVVLFAMAALVSSFLTTVWYGNEEAYGRTAFNNCQGVSEKYQVKTDWLFVSFLLLLGFPCLC